MATTRREFLKNVSLASVGMAIGGVDMIASAADKPAAAGASSPKGGKVKIAYIGIGNRGEQIINDFAKTGMSMWSHSATWISEQNIHRKSCRCIRTQNGSRISVRCLTKPAILLTL